MAIPLRVDCTEPGFVDDTRAFSSVPARHDLSRRADAGRRVLDALDPADAADDDLVDAVTADAERRLREARPH